MFIFALSPIRALFLSIPSVTAHGYVSKVVIDGTAYTGNSPTALGQTASNSPIRRISNIVPVMGASNSSINCGLNAQPATMVVPANPSSVMEFYWVNPSGGDWPHNTGPIMTYMAACDTSTCDKFNSSFAKFFKIDQIGKEPNGVTWYMQDIMNGSATSVTLPTQIAPGDYLVRHELIALQSAMIFGGAEFYVSCTQIHVGGSQKGTPNVTFPFPGAYSDNDPGIYDPTVYNPGTSYTFPGGPVSNLASPADMTGSGQLSGNNSPSSPAGNSSVSTVSASPMNSKPTSTSGARPTGIARSPLSWVFKLQNRDAPLSLRDAGIAQHKRNIQITFMRAICHHILSFLIPFWSFLFCSPTYAPQISIELMLLTYLVYY